MLTTYRDIEEHVTVLIQAFESVGIVRKSITRVGGGCVPQEDASHLTWIACCHEWIVFHDVAV